jgi:transcriptional regulator GlxA family with amidase domain
MFRSFSQLFSFAWAQAMQTCILSPVAKKTTPAGFKPRVYDARSERPHRIAVVAFDDVVLGDLSTPLEIFSRAQLAHGAAYQVRVCSDEPRVSTSFMSLDVPHRLAILRSADTVIVPGIEHPQHLDKPSVRAVIQALRSAAARGTRIASICTGALVLAESGALDGLRATTHWQAAAELARRHPRVQVEPDVLYIDNGQILTSAGAAAALDLCLYIVRKDLGAERAAAVAKLAVMPLERAGGQAQFIVHEPPAADSGSMGTLLLWLEQNLKRELSLPVIARKACLSTRTLSRHFKEQVGLTPAQWIIQARVRLAQRLLEATDMAIERLASEVGFRSPSILRAHFAAHLGTSPQAYRRSFRAA